MKIDEMAAGVDMDKLIDVKVFGHPQCTSNHAQSTGWCMSCNPPIWEELPGGIKAGRPTPNVRANGHWPRYSTMMDDWHGAAWAVVEELKKRGFHWWMSDCGPKGRDSDNPEDNKWSAHVRLTSCTNTIADGYADTMPLAICRAALKVVL